MPKTRTFIIAGALLLASCAGNQVTLKASPISHVAQMFDSTGVDADVVKQFPDGTRCAKLSGPSAVSVEGIYMEFYKLTCNGVTGYVNAKWVR